MSVAIIMSFQELLAMRAKKLGGKFSNPEAKGLRTEGGGEELSKEDEGKGHHHCHQHHEHYHRHHQ